MGAAGTIGIDLIAKTAKFSQGMKGAESAIKSLGGQLTSLKRTALGVGAAVLAGMGINSVKNFIQTQADWIDSTSKVADRLNIATEALVGLQHAADLAGVSADEFNADFEKLSRIGFEAADGNKEAADALALIGENAETFSNLALDEQMFRLADGVQQIGNAGQRADFAKSLLGRSGPKLINFLKEGRVGLQALMQESITTGKSFSRVQGAMVEAANDAMTRIRASIEGFGAQLAIAAAPAVERISKGIFSWIEASGGIPKITEKVVEFGRMLTEKVGNGFTFVMNKVLGFAETFLRELGRMTIGVQNLLDGLARFGLITKDDAKAAFPHLLAFNQAMHQTADRLRVFREQSENAPPAGTAFLAYLDGIRKKAKDAAEAGQKLRKFQQDAAKTPPPPPKVFESIFDPKKSKDFGDEFMSPIEKFWQEFQRLGDLATFGVINRLQFGRGLLEAQKQFLPASNVAPLARTAPLVEFGSQEAFSIMHNAGQQDTEKDQLQSLKEMLMQGITLQKSVDKIALNTATQALAMVNF